MDLSKRTSCAGTNTDGEPCKVPPLKGSLYCLNHDTSPSVVALRDRARREGGAQRGKQLRHYLEPDGVPPSEWALESHRDIANALAETARRLLTAAFSGPVTAREVNAGVATLLALSSEIDKAEAEALRGAGAVASARSA